MLETIIKIKNLPYWSGREKNIDKTLKGAISHCFDISESSVEVLDKKDI